ncbi:unnamed protein product [Brassica napus]|uniref:(rape) hypothetical protein n=1 Tax=Brassica napus TaxID=3708 RepID=A0A816RA71_BRANA|nr:unnamed protein product [Brassica napus]
MPNHIHILWFLKITHSRLHDLITNGGSTTSPKSNAPFFVVSLASHNSNPIIPDAFFTTHLDGNNELTKLKLTSDACDTTWQGRGNDLPRHTFRKKFLSDSLYISSSSDDSEADETDDDTDDDDDDDDGDDHGDETWDKVSYSRNYSPKKRSRLKTESSSIENSCILGVTSSNLRLNRVVSTYNSTFFTKANGLHKSWCEINVINQSGKSWVMGLRHNKGTGQDFMRGGWRSFCRANKLKTGSFYRFELVLTRTRPTLKLCSKAKVSAKPNRAGQRSSMNRSRFMTVTLKAYMLKSRQLDGFKLCSIFETLLRGRTGSRKEERLIWWTKMEEHGRLCVASGYVNGGFYLAKGWISFCKASGITTGETFTLKFVREKGKAPMLQFCSKAKTKVNTETIETKEINATEL